VEGAGGLPNLLGQGCQGAGIVVRFKDPDKYYLLRAVPHEKRVRLYKVENGKRTTFTGSNLAIPVDTWHELKLVVRGTS
jgi:hypothetical protein